jgi:hypothetical protein
MADIKLDIDDLVFSGVALLDSCGSCDAGFGFSAVCFGSAAAMCFFGVLIVATVGSFPSKTDGRRSGCGVCSDCAVSQLFMELLPGEGERWRR